LIVNGLVLAAYVQRLEAPHRNGMPPLSKINFGGRGGGATCTVVWAAETARR
jgi:hypothetical protein